MYHEKSAVTKAFFVSKASAPKEHTPGPGNYEVTYFILPSERVEYIMILCRLTIKMIETTHTVLVLVLVSVLVLVLVLVLVSV